MTRPDYWQFPTLPRSAARVRVGPDSYLDVAHLARVLAARLDASWRGVDSSARDVRPLPPTSE